MVLTKEEKGLNKLLLFSRQSPIKNYVKNIELFHFTLLVLLYLELESNSGRMVVETDIKNQYFFYFSFAKIRQKISFANILAKLYFKNYLCYTKTEVK